MSLLAWRRAPHVGRQAVVLLHPWAADAGLFAEAGLTAALEEAGLAPLAPDLPGHGGSAELGVPDGADPAAWSAAILARDLATLGVERPAVLGAAEGGMVAAHLAVGGEVGVDRLVLLACDDRGRPPYATEAARALRDPRARLWTPEASALVATARAGRAHDRATLATWLERATWPSAARFGVLRAPVLVAVGADDPLRPRAPALARLFHEGHLATAPGQGAAILAEAGLHASLVSFLTHDAP